MSRPLWMVTGASGLLGANVVLTLLDRQVPTVACYGSRPVAFASTPVEAMPLTDPGAVHAVVERHRPSVIIHCAADTRLDHLEEHPADAYSVNAEGARTVAEAAARVDAALIYISTDSVFDGARGGYSEADRPAPLNVYASSKLRGEEMVRAAAPEHLILRTNIFGWSPGPKPTLAEWVLERLQRGDSVPGFVDVRFTPLLVNDLAEVLLEAVGGRLRGTYHAGAEDAVSKYDFARAVAAAFSFDPSRVTRASSTDVGFRAKRPLDTTLDSRRLAGALGRRLPTIAAGIERFRQLHDRGHRSRLQGAVGC